jgi:hypothetical protein
VILDAVDAVSDVITNTNDDTTTVNTNIQRVRGRLKKRIQINNVLNEISIDPDIIWKNIRRLHEQRAMENGATFIISDQD